MGAVLAVCLAMVLGASFFAYKNLYFAGQIFTLRDSSCFDGNVRFTAVPLTSLPD